MCVVGVYVGGGQLVLVSWRLVYAHTALRVSLLAGRHAKMIPNRSTDSKIVQK